MKTAMKKLFSLMLVAVLLVGVMPFQAFADDILPTQVKIFINNEFERTQEIVKGKYTAESLAEACGVGPYDGVNAIVNSISLNQGDPEMWIGDNYDVSLYVDPVDTCSECGQVTCVCCPKCHKAVCVCSATVEVVINNVGTGDSFDIAAGKSVNDVFEAYKTQSFAKEGAHGPILTPAGTGTHVDATEAGKSYQLWLSWTEPTPDPATILIRAKKPSDAGYPDGGSFTVAAGTHGVTAIFEAANFSGNVEGYSVSDSNGNGVRRAGENIELAEGGTYILWIELKEESSDNTGSGNTGSGNTGSGNTGSGNTGSGNTGSGNTGSGNTGSGNTGSGNTGSGAPSTPAPSKPTVEKVTLTIDPSYKGAKTYTQEFVKGTKMSDVLKAVGIPSRRGYNFAGWHWDERGRDPVSNREVLSENDTIYAQWARKEKAEIILKIYVNGNTESAAKIVDMYEYARDNEIEISEAKEVVKKYYTAKDSDGMTIYGVFDSQNWKAFVRNKNHDGAKSLDINRDEDTVVYVMVHNVRTYSTSTATADSSNPKTGDMIYDSVIIMTASVGALATLFYLNKKKTIL